jgi:hypothetical protein
MDKILFNKDKKQLLQCSVGKSGAYTVTDTVTSIGFLPGDETARPVCGAFSGCTELTSVTIPAGVTWIGSHGYKNEGAFSGCSKLTSITVHEDNEDYSSVDGVLFDKDKKILFVYPAGKTGNFTMSDTCSTISDRAFAGCIGLTSITMTDSVTSIGNFAFSGTGLTSVSIPSGANFNLNMFSGCENLEDIELSEDNDDFSFD